MIWAMELLRENEGCAETLALREVGKPQSEPDDRRVESKLSGKLFIRHKCLHHTLPFFFELTHNQCVYVCESLWICTRGDVCCETSAIVLVIVVCRVGGGEKYIMCLLWHTQKKSSCQHIP